MGTKKGFVYLTDSTVLTLSLGTIGHQVAALLPNNEFGFWVDVENLECTKKMCPISRTDGLSVTSRADGERISKKRSFEAVSPTAKNISLSIQNTTALFG